MLLQKISELSGVEIKTLQHMNGRQLADEVILPKIVVIGGQDTRGWRIGDDFMQLMADYAPELYRNDSYSGEILLELALQRLSKGAVLHEAHHLINSLPPAYQKYSAAYDQYGLMSDACWNFLAKQASFCLKTNAAEHTRKIVFGLLDHLTPQGETLGSFMLGASNFKLSGRQVYETMWEIACSQLSFETLYEHFVTPQRYKKYSFWLKDNWERIDQKDFFRRIGVSGFFEKRKIRKEILKAA